MRAIPLPFNAGWKAASPPPGFHLHSPRGFQRVPFSANLTISLFPTMFILSDSTANTLWGGGGTRSVDAWWSGTFNFSQLGDSVGDTMGLGELGF